MVCERFDSGLREARPKDEIARVIRGCLGTDNLFFYWHVEQKWFRSVVETWVLYGSLVNPHEK